jgi:hypothetical protein
VTGSLLALAAGAVAGAVLWVATRGLFAGPLFARQNWRGRSVPTAAGLVVPLAALAVEAARDLGAALGVGDPPGTERTAALLAVVGFGLLGGLDDLAGDGGPRGFAGHLGALARGRLTTGAVKLAGGGALAVVACAPVSGDRPAALLRDAALVALAANLGNLFDRAPGRALKVTGLAFALLVGLAAAPGRLGGVAVAVGAGLALLVPDLRERLMLGDAGANALGGALGLGVVLACGPAARTATLAVVAALNLAAEVVSFSRVIGAVPVLRALDRLGRAP